MKKVLVLFLALVGVAFADDGATQIASFSALGGAIGMGHASNGAITGIARNPSIANKLTTTMFICLAMIEAQVIYTLVFLCVLLWANPLLG
ncbi:MAG: F0F1 ATP synthase subunit C [Campylobacter sp.]|nr:F0F1 ATP synthase subunit C [Campylobacter sp.]MBR4140299.1 F0F1 ATP synthase subunit C [Campylobacter sp.]